MKRILNISFWVLFIASIFVLLSFSESKKNAKLCAEIDVEVDWESGNQFITKKMIKTLINRIGYFEGESSMESINTKQIEGKIQDLSSVEEVSVFKNLNGQLKVKVKQRKPILRIFNQDGSSLYVDDKGKAMPLSQNFTARVVVVNGKVNEKGTLSVDEIKANDSIAKRHQLDNLYDFVMLYKKDEFFEAQIEQIYIERNGYYIIIPKVGDQKINFGEPIEMERKLKNYKTWMLHGINPENLNLYKEVNLKYNGQIVCTKK